MLLLSAYFELLLFKYAVYGFTFLTLIKLLITSCIGAFLHKTILSPSSF